MVRRQAHAAAGIAKKWLIIGCAGLGVLGIGGCIVSCVLLVVFGMNEVAEDVRAELKDNPVLVEQIGGIDTISCDLIASGEIEDMDTFVYTVTGPDGSGVLTVKSISTADGGEEVLSAYLETADGEVHDLFPDASPDEGGETPDGVETPDGD